MYSKKLSKSQHPGLKFFLVILVLSSLLIQTPARLAFAQPDQEVLAIRPLLCGKLTFFTNTETKAQLIGLIPCGESDPYIFIAHPAELLRYYQFRDAIVVTGDKIKTDKFGTLKTYIKTFKNYVPINGCDECGKGSQPTTVPTVEIATSTPAPTPTEPAPQAPPLCGFSTTAYIQSGMTAYTAPVIVPCGSTEPIAYGSLGQFGDDLLYRFTNPLIESAQPQESSLGLIQRQLSSWDTSDEIASCQVCNLPDPEPQLRNSLQLLSFSWEPQPKAFEPTTLVLNVHAEGSAIAGSAYLVDVDFGEDYPYNALKFGYDSEEASNREYLNPTEIQEGEFQIRIYNLRFPTTFNGSVTVSIAQKSDPDTISSKSETMVVSSSSHAYLECAGLASLTAKMGIPPTASNAEYIYLLGNIQQICGENMTCQAEMLADYQHQKVIDALGVFTGEEGLEDLILKFIEFGQAGTKCGQFAIEWVKALLHASNQHGEPISGFMTASPVYPLVENSQGQRAGFLPDGSIIADIPGAEVFQIGEQRLILVSEGEPVNITINGYDPGTMSLYLIQAQPEGGDLTLDYRDIPVEADSVMKVSTSDSQHVLSITSGGKSETRLPDEILQISASGEKTVLTPASQEATDTPLPVPQDTGVKENPNVCSSLGMILLIPVAMLIAKSRRRS